MGFILLSFFFIYYYFIVIVVCIILCGHEMLLHFCQVKRVTRWTDCYTEVMINIRMQLSLMLHRVYLEVLRKISYMRPVHNVCTGTQVLHWN